MRPYYIVDTIEKSQRVPVARVIVALVLTALGWAPPWSNCCVLVQTPARRPMRAGCFISWKSQAHSGGHDPRCTEYIVVVLLCNVEGSGF